MTEAMKQCRRLKEENRRLQEQLTSVLIRWEADVKRRSVSSKKGR